MKTKIPSEKIKEEAKHAKPFYSDLEKTAFSLPIKADGMRDSIHGCQLWFLPTYSPELNPIEHLWAVLKRYVRRFQHQFTSLASTLEFIFQTIPLFKGN